MQIELFQSVKGKFLCMNLLKGFARCVAKNLKTCRSAEENIVQKNAKLK